MPMPEPSSKPPVPIPDDDEKLLAECRVDFLRAGGPGGQHQNTTESAVRLTHEPTGISVLARDQRSQHRNRKIALERLRRRLEEYNRPPKKRKKTRPTRASERRRLKDKAHRARKKKLRKKPKLDD